MNVNDIVGTVEPMDAEVQARMLYWRSRRGLLELELLLGPFVRECYADLSAEAQRSYARLLDCDDVDIYDWLQNRSQPEDGSLDSIVALVRKRNAG